VSPAEPAPCQSFGLALPCPADAEPPRRRSGNVRLRRLSAPYGALRKGLAMRSHFFRSLRRQGHAETQAPRGRAAGHQAPPISPRRRGGIVRLWRLSAAHVALRKRCCYAMRWHFLWSLWRHVHAVTKKLLGAGRPGTNGARIRPAPRSSLRLRSASGAGSATQRGGAASMGNF
jgi:hypothetical protein